MSLRPISLSPDLSRLRREGYDIEIRPAWYLLVKNVPYVTGLRTLAFGTLISPLCLEGDRTIRPDPHTVFFDGETLCKDDGSPLNNIIAGAGRNDLGQGMVAHFVLSSKPERGHYLDYYEKMTQY